MDDPDPTCPECGEPIGVTATYCMHCSTDLTEEHAAADTDGDGTWDASASGGSTGGGTGTRSGVGKSGGGGHSGDGGLLDPDGLVDNGLTAVVGVVGGVVVGVVAGLVLLVVTGSAWALAAGLVAWLGSTAYLVRRRTVQAAVSRTGYAVAVVLLLVPVVAFSPAVSTEGGSRGGLFLVLLVFAAVPAAVAAAVGFVAGRFVPDGPASEG